MALQLIPDTVLQVLPGLAQAAISADPAVPRAAATQAVALAQEAFALMAVNAAPLALSTV
ncbi:hypothetical protein [uncultured Jannaschia sp.]|uniref:hypothetical protein n=1 Tax=uncultured Jannaschia sp. TaxID=293347 RepID=UPI00260ACF02|nr:hypothetical protein [uncultured Jannaschia sp.]